MPGCACLVDIATHSGGFGARLAGGECLLACALAPRPVPRPPPLTLSGFASAQDDFADVSWTLKNLALSDSDQEALAKTIKSIEIPADVVAQIDTITRG